MFHNRHKLAEPNVRTDWVSSEEWRAWGAPLNVVRGESLNHERFLSLCGPPNAHGYLLPVQATLVREPSNPVDKNAISVQLDGGHVGYIAEEIASQLSPELDRAKCESFMVAAIIRGGSVSAPSFGVHLWLDRLITKGPEIHIDDAVRGDPAFAVRWRYDEIDKTPSRPTAGNEVAGLRTGAHTHAGRWVALEEEDLLNRIQSGRAFLKEEEDPLERHYAFNVLEQALYKCRNAFPGAVTDFEAICEQHHQEMSTIRPALISYFGGVPFLPTYKQVAIMKTKAGDHAAAADWCKRGLDIYGADALETEGTTDLGKRFEKLSRKLPKRRGGKSDG